MRQDTILDLGLYFVNHSTKALTRENLHDFIVLVDVLKLEKYSTCFSDSEYILRNDHIEVVELNNFLGHDADLSKVFTESEESYDTFSVSTVELVEQAMLIFNYDEKTLNAKISLAITVKKDLPFSDQFYRSVLCEKYSDTAIVDNIIEHINHHKYIYKTFAL